jgi:hypothetical protein
MTLKLPFAAAAGAAAFALCATAVDAKPSGPPENHQCFLARLADGFAAPDEKHLYVRTSPRDVYEFEMFGLCNDLDWANHIALVSRGSSWICDHLDAEIISPSAIGPQHCLVRHMHKLTAEEIKALPKRARP